MPGTVKPSGGELQVPAGCQCRWWTDRWMDRWLLHAGASTGLEGSPWPSQPGLRCLPCLGLCLAGSQAAEATRLGPRLPPFPPEAVNIPAPSWRLILLSVAVPEDGPTPRAKRWAGGFREACLGPNWWC